MPELDTLSLKYDSSLRAYYRFNSGALTTDSSGNGYTLTNSNTVGETSSGCYGYAANFGASNTNKHFRIANDMGITNGAITMSLWFQNNGTTVNDQAPDLICHVDNGTAVRYSINLITTGYAFRRNGIGGGGTSVNATFAATPASGSNWDHVVLTYDTTTVRGYLNGVLVASGAASGNGNGFSGSYEGVTMGATHGWDGIYTAANATFSSISGKIDDVSIFSRAFSADEVLTLYKGGNTGAFFPFLSV